MSNCEISESDRKLIADLKASIALKREEVKKFFKDGIKEEAHYGNPYILLSLAKDLYAHAKAIMDLKLSAPPWADI